MKDDPREQEFYALTKQLEELGMKPANEVTPKDWEEYLSLARRAIALLREMHNA